MILIIEEDGSFTQCKELIKEVKECVTEGMGGYVDAIRFNNGKFEFLNESGNFELVKIKDDFSDEFPETNEEK